MVCVRDFPRGEVLVKVGVMEFGFNNVDRTCILLDKVQQT